MADIKTGPSREIQIAELEVQITQQELNIKSGMLRKRQIESELAKVDTNIQAAEKHREGLVVKLKELNNG